AVELAELFPDGDWDEVDEAVSDLRRRGRYIVSQVCYEPANVESLSTWIAIVSDLAVGGIKTAESVREVADAVDRATPNLEEYLIAHNHLPAYEPDAVLGRHILRDESRC